MELVMLPFSARHLGIGEHEQIASFSFLDQKYNYYRLNE